jgi:hypothetical protein
MEKRKALNQQHQGHKQAVMMRATHPKKLALLNMFKIEIDILLTFRRGSNMTIYNGKCILVKSSI